MIHHAYQFNYSTHYSYFFSFLAVNFIWFYSFSPSWRPSSRFLQSKHLQFSPHFMPAWKHSQYFFWQCDFLQWQPLEWCFSESILGTKAKGFLSIKESIALFLYSEWFSELWQSMQLQPSWQRRFSLKQSQYSFRHLVFLQLQVFLFVEAIFSSVSKKSTFFSTCLVISSASIFLVITLLST